MATALDPSEDDSVLELTEEQQVQPDEGEQLGPGDEGGDEQPGPDEEGEEETVIGFDGDDADQPGDSSVIRQLRQELRETKRQLRESSTTTAPPKIEVGPKPTMADCNYDEDEYEKQIDEWKDRKNAAAEQQRTIEEQNEEAQREFQADLGAFVEKKAKLAATVPDIDEAQATVEAGLDLVQQAVLVKAADDPALLMVALARNPAKLAELAKIRDPIKLGAAIARMEGGIKVVTKRRAPAPDRPQRGSAAIEPSDKKLERLEKEAEASGDRTAVQRYKRELKERAKK